MHIAIKIGFAFLMVLSLQGKAITIEGKEPAYAGLTIDFVTWSDPVSRNEKTLFRVTFDSNGNFSVNQQVTSFQWCYSDFGIYRGKIMLVPGQNLRIKFPPRKEKSFEESKNPYFRPVEVWLKEENHPDDGLTNLAARFDNRLNQLTDKYFNQLYYRQLKNYIDTIGVQLDKDFSNFKTPGFPIHRQLRMKLLEAELSGTGREKITGTIRLTPSDWNQPAFADYLNRLFVNTLSVESKSASGQKLRQWVSQRNSTELLKWTEKFTGTTSPLADLILLKLLHDAFYAPDFTGNSILEILKSAHFSANSQPFVRKAAEEAISKLTFLLPGTKAPDICLPSLSGSQFCASSNTKPFLYILFADLEIPVCSQQVKYLKSMAEKTGSSVQILLVLLPSKQMDIADFIKTNEVPGMVVLDTEKKTTGRMFKIRSYPSALLLNSSMGVILSSARTPLDGFENQFKSVRKP